MKIFVSGIDKISQYLFTSDGKMSWRVMDFGFLKCFSLADTSCGVSSVLVVYVFKVNGGRNYVMI